MRNILAKELKIKFIEILNDIGGFSYEDGNPFLIKIGAQRFFIFLKNLSPAYFKNSPDVTRVQLPYSPHFEKIFKANITFIILGYDVDNDTVVCWNPTKVKDRLNAKSNVSLYSRNSLQSKIKKNEFKAGYLSTGEKIVLFRRESLPFFFDCLPTLFETNKVKAYVSKNDNIVSEPKEPYLTDKLLEINDKQLLAVIKPLLKKNRVLEAVEICTKHYGRQYKNMNFKDWFKLVNDIYKRDF
jgi:hypothetical protein